MGNDPSQDLHGQSESDPAATLHTLGPLDLGLCGILNMQGLHEGHLLFLTQGLGNNTSPGHPQVQWKNLVLHLTQYSVLLSGKRDREKCKMMANGYKVKGTPVLGLALHSTKLLLTLSTEP